MSSEKDIRNIPGLNPDDIVTIKKLGFGTITKLRNKSTNAELAVSGGVNASMLLGEYTKWLIIYGIKKAPFFDKCRNVDERSITIDNDIIETITGDYLFKQIQLLNGFDKVEDLKKE